MTVRRTGDVAGELEADRDVIGTGFDEHEPVDRRAGPGWDVLDESGTHRMMDVVVTRCDGADDDETPADDHRRGGDQPC